jgi:hypothetical protein
MKKSEATISMEEIVKYWGSLEAYNEEQRRCGILRVETLATSKVLSGQSIAETKGRLAFSKLRFNLRLFGHRLNKYNYENS